jgi:hypothetical protein
LQTIELARRLGSKSQRDCPVSAKFPVNFPVIIAGNLPWRQVRSGPGSSGTAKTRGIVAVAALARRRRCETSAGGDDRDLPTNQIGRHLRQSIVVALRPAIDESRYRPRRSPPPSGPVEMPADGPPSLQAIGCRGTPHRHRRLLRARGQRPCGGGPPSSVMNSRRLMTGLRLNKFCRIGTHRAGNHGVHVRWRFDLALRRHWRCNILPGRAAPHVEHGPSFARE